MLNEKILELYKAIIRDAIEMVTKYVDPKDLTGNMNYAAIFSHSIKEFDMFSKELKENGYVVQGQPTGNYFQLKSPIMVESVSITICRVRIPDATHKDRGYLDFEPVDYKNFKNKYMEKPYFKEIHSILSKEHIELRDPRCSVRAYFPITFNL